MTATEFYIYTLTPQELELSRSTEERSRIEFENDARMFLVSQVARQKAWCNLIAQDWERAQTGLDLLPYETQESVHRSSENMLQLLENKLRNFTVRKTKKRKTTLNKDTGGMV